MNRIIDTIFVLLLTSVFSLPYGLADTINIPDNYTTIQAGIDASSDADTVLVQPGIYKEKINFNGKNIVLGSLFITTQDTSFISKTIIDGHFYDTDTLVTFNSGEDSTAVLIGLTIQKALGEANLGALPNRIGSGIYCKDSSPRLEHLIVKNNYGRGGGGIRCDNSSPIIENTIISNNFSGSYGGGVYIGWTSNPFLKNVIISNNRVWGNGGGGIYSSSKFRLENVTICFNSTGGNGGGILCYGNPILINVTISENISYKGGGIALIYRSNPFLLNTIVWNNYSEWNNSEEIYFKNGSLQNTICLAFSDIKGGKDGITTNNIESIIWLDGNISEDPLFFDILNNDFRLRDESPCIDAGASYYKFEDDIIIDFSSDEYYGPFPDMGSYEYQIVSNIDRRDSSPLELLLLQNHPNPFNQTTVIGYYLPSASNVVITIYNPLGQEIITLIKKFQQPGYKSIIWDGKNNFNNYVSSGVYIYKLKSGNNILSNKMLYLR